ncbi:MAG TPA: FAD-dependent oxidoreductase [Kofleriaceae bacterium]|nr:FAD-dependent oxidoreductase [Kofleriaceae bacterium]
MTTRLETRCCIAGGGPAGMVLGWLLARAGVPVIVLEKHADFLRDFRGDTVHPSTLELMHELGVLDAFLRVPHTAMDHIDLEILGERLAGPDFRGLPTHCKMIALMPQWDFLEFVRGQASQHDTFRLIQRAEVTELVRDGDRVVGVHARTPDGALEVRADLVVGTDGRHSTVRARAHLVPRTFSVPIDVLWMRLSRKPSDGDQVLGTMTARQFLVMLDRGDYWQCAYLIEKGALDRLRARGLPALRDELAAIVPFLADRVAELTSWDDLKLLTVVVDRLDRWWAPGVLCIGDAAHAMSPIGGVGINLAVQDAIATANRLAGPLRDRALTSDDLAAVQAHREPPAKKIQALQIAIHDHVLAKVLAGRGGPTLRLLRFALRHAPRAMRRKFAEVLAVGQLEHVV